MAGEAVTPVSSSGYVLGTSKQQGADARITRPNNATPYTANMMIGNATTSQLFYTNFFPGNGATGLLVNARLTLNLAAITLPAGLAVRAHIFNDVPPAALGADQVAFQSLQANDDVKLGTVDFSSFQLGGTGSDLIESYGSFPTGAVLPIVAAANKRSLVVYLMALGGFTLPASTIVGCSFWPSFN